MKIRESGMPEEPYWEQLFNVQNTLDAFGIGPHLNDGVEFGCGYGTFTLATASRISAMLHTFDIDPAMTARTLRRVEDAGLTNVVVRTRDFVLEDLDLPPFSQNGCLMFNILHGEDPVSLLKKGATLLKPGSILYATHWNFDPRTPRGPSLDIRPKAEDIIGWAESTGLLDLAQGPLDLPPWHFGLKFYRCGPL